MEWKKVNIKNFLSITEANLNLDKQGLVLIEGVNETNESFKSNGSGKCLVGDQRIYDMMTNEYIPIDQFVEEKRTLTLGVVKGKLEEVEVIDWHYLGEKQTYKVTTDNGSEIHGAGTHPIYTEYGSIKIKDLKIGDSVFEVKSETGITTDSEGKHDIFLTNIESIESMGTAECYDITVDTEEHLYVSENFVVHNSSVLESVLYALYDTTPKGIKADDVVNRNVGKNTSVTLEGEMEGNTYRIERYRKHSTHKNKVKLFMNDKNISEKSAKDTNATIEKLVGVDYNTFINSIYFSQGDGSGRFSKATDREKKEILENLVNLSIYAHSQEVAKEKVKEQENKVNEAEREEERLNWELDNVDNLEKQDQENYEQTENMIDEEHKNIENLTKEMEDYTRQYSQSINEIKGEKFDLEEQRETTVSEDISGLYEEANNAQLQLNQSLNNVTQLTNNKDNLVNQYKDVQSKTNCPVCGNLLNQEHREKEMANLKEQVKNILIEIQQAEQDVEEKQTVFNELNEKYKNKKSEVDQIRNSIGKINQRIGEIEDAIQNFDNGLRDYKNRISNSQATLTKLGNLPKPQPRTKEREEINSKIKGQKEKIVELNKEKGILEDVVKIYSNSGVKSHVLDLITPYLNERANKYLNRLTGSGIEVTFSTQKKKKDGEMSDKFDIQISNEVGGETYNANSEGEKKRIDLAISLAIQDLVVSKSNLATNMIIYDEIFDALDDVGSENAVELLKERLGSVGTIFVVTHSEHLKNLFENKITVTKDKNGNSTITEGERIGA